MSLTPSYLSFGQLIRTLARLLGSELLPKEADPGPGIGKGARKREQVSLINPFRNSPKAKQEVTSLLLGAKSNKSLEAEVVASTSLPDLKTLLLHRIDVGGRLLGFRNAWRHNSWAFRVVSRGLTWRWFPRKPPLTNIKGQTATPLLKSYVSEMLEMKAIVPTTGKVVQSRLFPVDKKGTTKKTMVLDMSQLYKFIPCLKFRMTTT